MSELLEKRKIESQRSKSHFNSLKEDKKKRLQPKVKKQQKIKVEKEHYRIDLSIFTDEELDEIRDFLDCKVCG